MPPPGRFTVGPPLTEIAITLEVVDPVVPVELDVERVPPPQPAIVIVPVRKSETRKNENRCLCTTCSCLFYFLRLFVIAVVVIATARGLLPRASELVCTRGPSARACGHPSVQLGPAAEYREDGGHTAWVGMAPVTTGPLSIAENKIPESAACPA